MSTSARAAVALSAPFGLEPDYRQRVWGGQRLQPSADPIGEAWLVCDANRIVDGPLAGYTLAAAAQRCGASLLGSRVLRQTGTRFPLLIKLLDTAAWISVQVHPDDAQAARLEGPGHWGKAEGWHVLEAAPGAEVITGLHAGTTGPALTRAIRDGTLLDIAARTAIATGDTMMVAPGTIHALGPGLLVYEVQQASDITYRVFDWDRPQTNGRVLHVEQSLAVARADRRAEPYPLAAPPRAGQTPLLASPWFSLTMVCAAESPVALHTMGKTFHALTAIDGTAELCGAGWVRRLARLEHAVLPAACGAYTVRGVEGPCRVLLAMP